MAYPSSTKVAMILTESGYAYTPAEVRSSCEAYGPTVFAYLRPSQGKTIDDLKEVLRNANIAYSPHYGGCAVEVRVSYFKADHWDE